MNKAKNDAPLFLRDPNGELHHVLNLPLFCLAHQLDLSEMRHMVDTISTYKGWAEEKHGEQ